MRAYAAAALPQKAGERENKEGTAIIPASLSIGPEESREKGSTKEVYIRITYSKRNDSHVCSSSTRLSTPSRLYRYEYIERREENRGKEEEAYGAYAINGRASAHSCLK